ncbi:MAG: ABC transporter ATP-binding protein [Hyphomicrobiaceae bacterium]
MTAPALAIEGVEFHFGGLRAVDGVDMQVRAGSIHGLVGPNGAGKTTLFNVIAGLYAPTRGRVLVAGQDVTRLSPEARVASGLCRTFQTPQLFEDMTVLETAMAGCHLAGNVGILGSMLRLGAKRRDEAELEARALQQIGAVGLAQHKHVLARNLSYGQRRLLEIARAMAAAPSVLLLDEVTAGLNPSETDKVAALIRSIADGNVTVVLIEHDMRFVLGLSERVTVLNFGRKLAEGTPAEIVSNEEVVMAYLGRKGASYG